MSGIYIPGVTVPEDNTILLRIFPESDGIYYTEQLDIDEDILDKYFAIPVPDHGLLLRVLKTERECVSRDCDRNCGKCDLSLERGEILNVYDAIIDMISSPADKEAE